MSNKVNGNISKYNRVIELIDSKVKEKPLNRDNNAREVLDDLETHLKESFPNNKNENIKDILHGIKEQKKSIGFSKWVGGDANPYKINEFLESVKQRFKTMLNAISK